MTISKTQAKKRAPVTNGAKASYKPGKARSVAAATAAPVAPATAKPKARLIRDSFTIPKSEYAVLDALKLRAAKLMRPTKKSEVLRAGIFALNGMNDKALLAALNSVPSLKTGRPKNLPMPAPSPAPALAAKPRSRPKTDAASPVQAATAATAD